MSHNYNRHPYHTNKVVPLSFDIGYDSYSSDSIGVITDLCNKSDADITSCSSTIDAIREVCNKPDIKDINAVSRKTNKIRIKKISHDSTIDDIHSLCNSKSSKSFRDGRYRDQYDPGISSFNSVITPVTGLTPSYSGITGSVQFKMRRKNKTVTLQWEPFSGCIAQNGVAFLTVAQTIWNTPPYPLSIPISIKYKDTNRLTTIIIDPHSTLGNIRFNLNTDGTGTNINANDFFYIYAGAVSWIVD